MRVAVISDIHANLHALDSVVDEIDAERVDAIWCLGDLVGYGPRPNECCTAAQARARVCLIGNHDLLALGTIVEDDDFNPDAAAAGHWTRTVLEDDCRGFLAALEPQARTEGAELFHASPRDPVWEYVLSGEAAAGAFGTVSDSLILVGHSHVALAFTLDGNRLSGDLARGGTELELTARHLLNPGSVGQPRDGDPRAGWLMVDLEARRARFERVEYDVRRTQDEMRARGLPGALADRLAVGL
ncbi:MAG TPA: metallophosphoesterase family protein [Gaiellaceae bacterium]|nr:metallophosphoesterase family protein [Gaiellaceae bacterium]